MIRTVDALERMSMSELPAGSSTFRCRRSDEVIVAEWEGLLTLRATATGDLLAFEPARDLPRHRVEKLRDGVAAAFLRSLRGSHSLHAAAVASAGATLICVGRSGAGKSTLAAGLCEQRDVELLSDDIAALELRRGLWHVVPSEASIWLHRRRGAGKAPVRSFRTANRPAAVQFVVHLSFDDTVIEPAVRLMHPIDALGVLMSAMVRFDPGPMIWLRELDLVETLLRQARVFEVVRSHRTPPARVARSVTAQTWGNRR